MTGHASDGYFSGNEHETFSLLSAISINLS